MLGFERSHIFFFPFLFFLYLFFSCGYIWGMYVVGGMYTYRMGWDRVMVSIFDIY